MFRFDADRLARFFDLLPRDTAQALALARRRDERMRGRARLAIDACRPLRHAVEVRHASFICDEFVALLKRHDIGLVVADTAGKWPKLFDVTSDFVYVRLHGDIKIYTSGYTSRALDEWAARIRKWDAAGTDVYVYFDNDVKVRAPFDALVLMQKLGLRWEPAVSGEDGEAPYRLRRAGERVRLRNKAYGPRVTRDNPAWQPGK